MQSMLDAQNAPAAPPTEIRRDEYRPPEWLVPEIALNFDLDPKRTIVRATLQVERNGDHREPLRLNAEALEVVRVLVDGGAASFALEEEILTVTIAGDRATVETEVALAPAANTQLMGLYESGGILCTQCEAEGFRRIT